MGVHRKIGFLGGVHEKPIYRGNCLKKRGFGQFVDLRGSLAKKREGGVSAGWYPNPHSVYNSHIIVMKL